MEPAPSHRKEPLVPGPNVERRIPPQSTGRLPFPKEVHEMEFQSRFIPSFPIDRFPNKGTPKVELILVL